MATQIKDADFDFANGPVPTVADLLREQGDFDGARACDAAFEAAIRAEADRSMFTIVCGECTKVFDGDSHYNCPRCARYGFPETEEDQEHRGFAELY
jgi:hypothetical protein